MLRATELGGVIGAGLADANYVFRSGTSQGARFSGLEPGRRDPQA